MKHLLVGLLLLVTSTVKSQDGLYTFFIDEDGRDTLISFFNSSPAELHPIANNLITSIIAGDIKANLYTLHLPGDIIVDGQMYVTKKWSYIAFDFYVIRIRYPNGRVYEASRIKRPE
jgi:hypothetical protein